MIRDKPQYLIRCESYHIEYYEVYVRGKYGYDEKGTQCDKKYTYIGSEYIDYYSIRDVSGLLEIPEVKNKKFIQLKIEPDIQFDNDDSRNKFEKEKKEIISDFEHKDRYSDIDEKIIYKELNSQYQMMKLSEEDDCFINCFIFIIFYNIL